MTDHLVRVLVVDDQELVRAGLRGILRERYGFTVVGELGTGAGLLDAVIRTRPDIVVMDVRMPEVDGVAATQALTAAAEAPPVLILTTFDDDAVLAGSLRAGAAGFLLKDAPAEDLQRAVRAVVAGGSWLDPAVTGRVLSGYRERALTTGSSPRVELLTPREKDVLDLIGAGFTNAEIAAELFLGEGTVKTHVGHIFAKLHLRDRSAAVVFAFDHGLVRPGERRPSAAADGRAGARGPQRHLQEIP
ncbi:response regulator transcription factor [Aeromicrobium sp. YIM 150415]|uniref:response regulator n=1 Tax=Aeromicrobium sp. YIM 150415 TaxID=2803912 RepID=UPI0019643CA9|nr:response regulator transcription factor [Aeromicrobium sp. YIM 150415]MBM9465371.1 response regulator transcription factor [Aeromicrobium sp. YIM 150415]